MLGYPLKVVLNAIEKRYGHEAVVQLLLEAEVKILPIAPTGSMCLIPIVKPSV